jgi:hypothetical protein
MKSLPKSYGRLSLFFKIFASFSGIYPIQQCIRNNVAFNIGHMHGGAFSM